MVLDIILILVFILTVWRGFRKGFISAILKFACFIVAGLLCYFFRDTIGDFAMKLPLATRIGEMVKNALINNAGKISEIPFIGEGLINTAESITRIIVTIIACLVIFIILVVIFNLLAKLLRKILKAIKLGFLDDILGGVLGAVNGYIIVYVIILAMTALAPISSMAYNAITKSMLVYFIPNPIELWVMLTNF